MGTYRDQYIIYGYKMPYKNEDDVEKRFPKLEIPFEAQDVVKNIGKAIYLLDGMDGEYRIFGILVNVLQRYDEVNYKVEEIIPLKAPRKAHGQLRAALNEYWSLIDRDILDRERKPELLLVTHYH